MKTIEQKAKAYDEALEKAKSMIDVLRKGEDILAVSDLESMFPELKESEDDRIRKSLITFFQCFPYTSIESAGTTPTEVIAWLKKQDEHANFLSKIQVGDKVTRNEGGVLVNISQLERVAKPRRVKPIDKVKPKFHEGDWVILTAGELSITLQIVNVDTNKKLYWFNDSSYLPIVDEECLHLWTIQDVKDGDMLQLGKVTAIFQKYIGNGICKCYCSVCDGEIEIPSHDDDNTYGCHNAIPATKEQRGTLMKAVADAGYTFDFEKKELKKIDTQEHVKQNPAWSEEDEEFLRRAINAAKEAYPATANWLKSLKQRIGG